MILYAEDSIQAAFIELNWEAVEIEHKTLKKNVDYYVREYINSVHWIGYYRWR